RLCVRASGRRQKSAIIVSNEIPRTSTATGRWHESTIASYLAFCPVFSIVGSSRTGFNVSRILAASSDLGPSSKRLPSAFDVSTEPPKIDGSRLTGTYQASPSFQEKESPTSSACVGTTDVVSVSSAK